MPTCSVEGCDCDNYREELLGSSAHIWWTATPEDQVSDPFACLLLMLICLQLNRRH